MHGAEAGFFSVQSHKFLEFPTPKRLTLALQFHRFHICAKEKNMNDGRPPVHPQVPQPHPVAHPQHHSGNTPPSSRLTNNAHIPESLQRKPVKDEPPLELEELEEWPSAIPATTAAPMATAATSVAPSATPPPAPPQPHSKIHSMSAGGISAMAANHTWTRGTHKNQTGAVRVRSFHCRLSDQGLEHIDHAINDWLDRHPDIEVKFSTSTIGQFDGKIKEAALIVNVWY